MATPHDNDTVVEGLSRLSITETEGQALAGSAQDVSAVAGLEDVVESLRELIGMLYHQAQVQQAGA